MELDIIVVMAGVRLERRHALFLVGAAFAGAAYAAFGPQVSIRISRKDSPIDRDRQLPDLAEWRKIVIPANTQNAIVKVDDVQKLHFPDIGINELYLIPSNKDQIVAVYCSWGGSGRRRVIGKMGFQTIEEPFVPSIASAGTHIDTGIIPRSRLSKFMIESVERLTREKGEVDWRKPNIFLVIPMPPNEKDAALIFAGIAEGQPPQSVLAVRFKFEVPEGGYPDRRLINV